MECQEFQNIYEIPEIPENIGTRSHADLRTQFWKNLTKVRGKVIIRVSEARESVLSFALVGER